jgi:hypothetical protein
MYHLPYLCYTFPYLAFPSTRSAPFLPGTLLQYRLTCCITTPQTIVTVTGVSIVLYTLSRQIDPAACRRGTVELIFDSRATGDGTNDNSVLTFVSPLRTTIWPHSYSSLRPVCITGNTRPATSLASVFIACIPRQSKTRGPKMVLRSRLLEGVAHESNLTRRRSELGKCRLCRQ